MDQSYDNDYTLFTLRPENDRKYTDHSDTMLLPFLTGDGIEFRNVDVYDAEFFEICERCGTEYWRCGLCGGKVCYCTMSRHADEWHI